MTFNGVNCFSEKGVAGIFFWIVVNSNKIASRYCKHGLVIKEDN